MLKNNRLIIIERVRPPWKFTDEKIFKKINGGKIYEDLQTRCDYFNSTIYFRIN